MNTDLIPKLPGYRTLSPEELMLISSLKIDLGATMLTFLNETRMYVNNQRVAQAKVMQRADSWNSEGQGKTLAEQEAICQPARAEIARIDAAQPERWIAIANSHFQEGLMALVRAVTQPEGF